MLGAAHEMMVKVLKEHPEWFDLLLRTLTHRGLAPDRATLERWHARAMTAATVDAVFDEAAP